MRRISIPVGFAMLLSSPPFAQTLPAGFAGATVISNLAWPTRMAFAPDGRLFILEQAGRIRVVKDGQLLAAPFATVTTETSVVSNSEEGLLGLAVDPAFADNGYVYVNYTALSPSNHQRISRFKAQAANPDLSDPAEGEKVLIDFDRGGCHCGGALEFGPDGKLYVGTGDGYDTNNPQSLATLKGKVLRMNPVPDSAAQVPSDNPFMATATGRNRLIWAIGLRNPFSMAFQPGTGRLYINDVGLSTYEEVNEGMPGRNFGWPTTEGPFASAQYPQFSQPVLGYRRDGAGPTLGGLIVGGAFYNPAVVQFPQEYVGKYFFSDYSYNGWVRRLNPADSQTTAFVPPKTGGNYLDVDVGPDGALYYLSRSSAGSLVRVSYGPNAVAESLIPGMSLSVDPRSFAPGPVIRFSLPGGPAGGAGRARLEIFALSGARVATLADGPMAAGPHALSWNAAAPGVVYQVVLRARGRTLTRALLRMN